jgi:hypothetical protein
MVAADRAFVVRQAAQAWRRAGAIDDATVRAVDAAYPDDRRRLGVGLRILAAVATVAGGMAIIGLVELTLHVGMTGVPAASALIFIAATELQTGRWRRAQAGTEYATAILGAICACVFVGALADFHSEGAVLFVCAIVWAAASWRWGYAFFAIVAALFALVALADGHHARAGALLLGAASLPLLLISSRLHRLAPSHRRVLDLACMVFLVAAYAAGNVYALDTLGMDPEHGHLAPSGWARGLAIAATILFPPWTLILGVIARHKSLLLLGALFTAASLATLRFYVHIAPIWVVLALSGVVCATIALALKHALSPERGGWTAEPLFDDRRGVRLAQAAATLAVLTPAATAAAPKTFDGGGGLSGGGGAQGQF